MNRTLIQTPEDPRLAAYLDLKDRDVRRETGLFLAEGEHVVRRAFEAGLAVRSVLVVESKVERVLAMAEASPAFSSEETIEVLACPKDVIEESVGFVMHQGIIAAVEPPAAVGLEAVLGDESCGLKSARPVILVCPEITNVDNLGVLVRVAAGLGVKAMVLGPKCCDPWYRRAVRVSMGAVFAMPMVRSVDLDADLTRMQREFGVELVATVIDADATPLRESPPFAGPGAILLGSEGYGLSPEVVGRCDRKVRIPMHHDIDSLNVAVAAGIVVHHFCEG
ncbi:TrmH family RNA methyltransferase [Algisphaera agarilytica]|uniref:TrmH family RNA methyltransferase n=1 Tax=Algisphaera agarilytica TaxID=1385975 RepID=UPI001C86E085|nr:RNA methyltransferase [Algisphaera agarilytica]